MAIGSITPNPLAQLVGANRAAAGGGPETGNPASSFAGVLGNLVGQAQAAQTQASAATAAVAAGQDVPLHEVVQAISQAELTLQTLVSVRDRAVEAYQEIARMPI